jgi:hypothetical protein
MRVIEQSAERLVLEDNPVVLGVILALAILLPAGISLAMLASGSPGGLWALGIAAFLGIPFVVFVRRTRVILDRSIGAAVIRTATLRGTTETSHPLAAIRAAGIETSLSRTSTGGRSTTHRPVLQFHGDAMPLPLDEVYSSGGSAQRTADAINAWLIRERH